MRDPGSDISFAPGVRPKANDVQVSIVLPAYNEAAALPLVLSDLCDVLERYPESEIIVVDDGSKDDTAAVAGAYPCRLIRHEVNRGKGASLSTGFSQAYGRYIITMDADATYPADAIPKAVDLLKDHDLVRGIRQSNGQSMPLINRVGNTAFDLLLTKVLRMGASDPLSGFYGMRREIWDRLGLEAAGFDIEVEIAIKARSLGLKVGAFPLEYQPRVGEKKLSPWRDGWRILNRILAMMLLHDPVSAFMVPGLIIMILSGAAALALRERPLVTRYFGLSTNSFILASLGVLAGFQLAIFGIAAALYGVEAGHWPRRWLVLISSRRVRFMSVGVGLAMILVGGIYTLDLVLTWTARGAGAFLETVPLVMAATCLVWGLQIVSAALFLSIFAGRLHQPMRGQDR